MRRVSVIKSLVCDLQRHRMDVSVKIQTLNGLKKYATLLLLQLLQISESEIMK